MFFFYFLFSILFYQTLKTFPKKLTCLLFLEALTIMLLFFSFYFFNESNNLLSSVSLVMVCMMVLDSVFGLCLLVNFSRNDSNINFFFGNL